MPVRIYEIAKKLGIESKEVLAKAKTLGITAARVPSSSLDKITAEYLEEQMGGVKKAPAPAPVIPEPIAVISEAPPVPVVEAPTAPVEVAVPEPIIPPTPAPVLVTQESSIEEPAAPIEAVLVPETVVEEMAAPKQPEPTTETKIAAEISPIPAPTPIETAPVVEKIQLPPPIAYVPRVGDKVGFIHLPPKPGARTGEKAGAVKSPNPPTRFGGGGRQDAPRTGGGAPGQFNQRPGDRRFGGPPSRGNNGGRTETSRTTGPSFVAPDNAATIIIKPPIIVRDLAERLKRKPFQLIADLMEVGVFATVNQAIDETVAQRICAKHGFKFEVEKRERGGGLVHAPEKIIQVDVLDKAEDLKPRAPVVTIMGHVDHGKTTLLDVIRKSDVAAGEAGGITQHIGAYTISFPHPERKNEVQQITFLDTPGHAAFSAMRARGANVTDIVILVVAANDGVMPQTLEALSHAQAAKVPIIVAVNKTDHPNANAMRVRQQLQERGLVPEEWGGNTIFVDVSAITKVGVDKLLELVLLQAEIMELKANPVRAAKGNVIESGLQPGGPTATVLVRKGTLRVGNVVLCGNFYGKVRALINEEGNRLKEAAPSVAVRMLGLNGVPEAGLEFTVVESDKSARELTDERIMASRAVATETRAKVTLETLFATLQSNTGKNLKLVIKADMQGSLEAIVEALKKLDTEKVSLEIIHSAVGTITESDVLLASASEAIILGFHTRIDNSVSEVAKREGVQIKLYSIIYELIDEVKEAMAGLLDPILKEVITGAAEVRKVFSLSKGGNVAGCVIANGRLTRGKARVMRRKGLIYEGNISSLRRFQDEVSEVRAGMECGIRIDGFNDFQPGDSIECFVVEKVTSKL